MPIRSSCFALTGLLACAQAAPATGPLSGPTEPAHTAADRGAGCPFGQPGADAAQGVLVLPIGAALTRVEAGRTARVVYTFGAALGVAEGNVDVDAFVARDGFVAAHAMLVDPAAGVRHEVVLLDPTGGVRWHRAWPNSTNPTLHLGARGALAVDTNEGTLEREGSWVIATDGAVRNVQGYSPLAAPASNGEVPVRRGSLFRTTSADFGWLDPVANAFRPLARGYEPEDAIEGAAPRWVGERLVYRTRDGGALALVAESLDGTARTLPLPAAPTDTHGPSIADTSDAGWVLLTSNGGDAVRFRANVATGEFARVAAGVPADLPAAVPLEVGPVLDDGALLGTFLTTAATGLYRSDDAGRSWTLVGDAAPAMPGPRVERRVGAGPSHGGTTLVFTTDQPLDRFASLAGPTQVVRPVDGVARQIAPAADGISGLGPVPTLSLDGLCVAYWETDGTRGTLHALDVRSGERLDLLTTDHWGAVPTWLR